MTQQAVVVGAGFGGLAAALRLRARGLKVQVLDAQHQAGGRATRLERGPFSYDAGPTVLTAPVLLQELFGLFNERLEDHVSLLPVAPWYRMLFADGRMFNYGGTTEDIEREIAKFNVADAARYRAFLGMSGAMFDAGYLKLGDQPFRGWTDMAKAMPDMIRLRADRSVYAATAKYFEDDCIRRAFSIQPLLVGGNPMDTTSIYSLIHALERRWGVWFVKGGMHALVLALVALAQRHGVQFEWGQKVTRLQTHAHSKQVKSIGTDSRTWDTDVVVSNADPALAHTWLGHAAFPKPMLGRPEYSMGLFVWYFSTKRQYPDVVHHTILFGNSYEGVLRDIFDAKQLNDDLSIYLHRPTATDPSCAPAGHDSFYALVPVPNLTSGIDWQVQGPRLKRLLQTQLQERILPGLDAALVDDFFVTPEHFLHSLHTPHGAAFSLKPTLMQSAAFRYPNASKSVKGLYFVGAGTHPGAGVPGVLTSAKTTERCVFGDVASAGQDLAEWASA
jgi:phytoene desaturase